MKIKIRTYTYEVFNYFMKATQVARFSIQNFLGRSFTSVHSFAVSIAYMNNDAVVL